MDSVLALILAGGQGDRLSVLSEQRAKPAVVFGGRYRIIDFALSNCGNSGLTNVAVLTQYRPRSLVTHIGSGWWWGLDSVDRSVQILQPYLGRDDADWYQGTADAVHQNLYLIEELNVDEVLILAGDHIYLTSYRNMLAYHRSQGADVTVGVYPVDLEHAHRFGVLDLDERGRIVDFEEKPANPRGSWISMGIYIFNREVLVDQLLRDAALGDESRHDFGRDIIPRMFGSHRIFGYQYSGYWRDVGTVESYWQANMDLIGRNPPLDLMAKEHRLRTVGGSRPPAMVGPSASLREALLSSGSTIHGLVERSVISPEVVIEPGAVVRDSVIQHGCVIHSGAVVDRCILDKEVTVGPGAVVGIGDPGVPNKERPDIVNTGITILGKRTVIPGNLRVGRNVVIGPGVSEELEGLTELESGASIRPRIVPLHMFV